MSLYLKQIEQLISLQKVDDEIHGIKQELEGAPREVENLRARFAETADQRSRQQDKMAHLREQEKRFFRSSKYPRTGDARRRAVFSPLCPMQKTGGV